MLGFSKAYFFNVLFFAREAAVEQFYENTATTLI